MKKWFSCRCRDCNASFAKYLSPSTPFPPLCGRCEREKREQSKEKSKPPSPPSISLREDGVEVFELLRRFNYDISGMKMFEAIIEIKKDHEHDKKLLEEYQAFHTHFADRLVDMRNEWKKLQGGDPYKIEDTTC